MGNGDCIALEKEAPEWSPLIPCTRSIDAPLLSSAAPTSAGFPGESENFCALAQPALGKRRHARQFSPRSGVGPTALSKGHNPNHPQPGSSIKVEPIRTKVAIENIKKISGYNVFC